MKLKSGVLAILMALATVMVLWALELVSNRLAALVIGIGLVAVPSAKLLVMFSPRANAIWGKIKEMSVTDAMWVIFSDGNKGRLLFNVCLINAVFNNPLQKREVDAIKYRLLDFINRASFIKISLPVEVKIKLHDFYKKHEQMIMVIDYDQYPIPSKKEEYKKFLGEMEEYIIDLSRILLDPEVCRMLEKMEDGNSVANTYDLSAFQAAMRGVEDRLALSKNLENSTDVKIVGT